MAIEIMRCAGCGEPVKETTFACRNCGVFTDPKLGAKPTSRRSAKMFKGTGLAVAGAFSLLVIAGMLTGGPHQSNGQASTAVPKSGSGAPERTAWEFPSNDRADVIAEVRRRIAMGTPESTSMATILMTQKFGLGPVHADPDLKPLWDEAKAAYEKADAGTLGDDFAARADHWRHEVENMPVDAPGSVQDVLARLTTLETAAQTLGDEDKANPTTASRKSLSALRTALKTQQVEQFPILRSAYAKLLRETTWENNVEVHAAGAGYRTLIFTGAVFADNGAKAQMERSSEGVFQRLRFSKVRYEWFKDGDGATYTLRTMADSLMGYWQGATFVAIT